MFICILFCHGAMYTYLSYRLYFPILYILSYNCVLFAVCVVRILSKIAYNTGLTFDWSKCIYFGSTFVSHVMNLCDIWNYMRYCFIYLIYIQLSAKYIPFGTVESQEVKALCCCLKDKGSKPQHCQAVSAGSLSKALNPHCSRSIMADSALWPQPPKWGYMTKEF